MCAEHSQTRNITAQASARALVPNLSHHRPNGTRGRGGGWLQWSGDLSEHNVPRPGTSSSVMIVTTARRRPVGGRHWEWLYWTLETPGLSTGDTGASPPHRRFWGLSTGDSGASLQLTLRHLHNGFWSLSTEESGTSP